MIEFRDVVAITAVGLSAATFLFNKFHTNKQIYERVAKLEEANTSLTIRLTSATDSLQRNIAASTQEWDDRIDREWAAQGKVFGEYKGYIQTEFAEMNRRLVSIESSVHDVPVIRMKMDLFWKAIEEHVPGMLMHPDDMERDILIAKLKGKTLSREDARRLKAFLEVDLHHMANDDPRKWAPLIYSVKCDYIIHGLENRNEH